MAFVDDTTGGRIVKGIGIPVKITLTDTCLPGDLIGFDAVTSNAWERADADAKVYAQFIAGERCNTSGDTITCFSEAYIGGITTTSGDTVYLSTTAGQYTAAPTTWMQAVGLCTSTTEFYCKPNMLPVVAYDGTGTGYAGYFRAELESGRTSPTHFAGLRVDVKTISGATVTSDVWGAYIFVQCQQAVVGASSILRLEDGCASACGVDSYILFITGTGDPPDYLFELGSVSNPTNAAWSTTASSGTSAGRIKVRIPGGATRYISLNSD